jgi:hypothetical protein
MEAAADVKLLSRPLLATGTFLERTTLAFRSARDLWRLTLAGLPVPVLSAERLRGILHMSPYFLCQIKGFLLHVII